MTRPARIDTAIHVLGLGDHEHVCLVGAGGKTTLLFRIGASLDGRVILTSTTKMGTDRTGGLRPLFDPDDDELSSALDRVGRALVWKSDEGHKALGVTPETCDRWFDELTDHVVVEGDGSRQQPFKAPAAYEPVIPSTATIVIHCVGAPALGGRVEEVCHRPERVGDLVGCRPEDELTVERAATVLTHPLGGGHNVPSAARRVVAINRVEPGDTRSPALADALHREGLETLLIAAD